MAFIPAAEPVRGPRRFSIPLMVAAMLVVAAALALPRPAWAADEVFTVSDVAVDATAATAAAARERAIQDGQRRAFDRLLQRLTPAAERPRLPRLSDIAVADLVRDFEISGEKTSSVRYIADLTVRFKPAETRNFLRQRGLAFAETPSKPVLVLPVYYADASGAVLFEDNPWRAAWAGLAPGDGLVPFLLPRDDDADAAAITPAQAEAGDAAALHAIAARYGTADVLVAVARAHPEGTTGRDALDVSASRFGIDANEQSVVSAFAPKASDASAYAVYDRAAAAVAERVEESWKQASLLRFDSQQELSVRVPLEGLDSLVTVMRGLDGLAQIQRVDLVHVARDEAEVHLQFVGDTDQLTLLLAQRDLALRREADGFVLRSTASARAGGPQ
jgi:hypothetical protein